MVGDPPRRAPSALLSLAWQGVLDAVQDGFHQGGRRLPLCPIDEPGRERPPGSLATT